MGNNHSKSPNQENKSTERRQNNLKYDSKKPSFNATTHPQSENESENENLVDINDLQEGIQADDEDNDQIETERNFVKNNKKINVSSSVHYYGDMQGSQSKNTAD